MPCASHVPMDWSERQVSLVPHRSWCLTVADASNYFGPTIYANLGFKGHTTLMINGISGAWQVLVVWVFIQFIGKSTL